MSLALFPAWRPEAGRDALLKVTDALRAVCSPPAGLTVRRPDQWHLTLCFVGHDVGTLITSRAMQALASVGAEVPPHDIELDFLVHNVQSGSIIAIPRSSRELEALCDACCAALRRHGIVPAHATRQPHITLAYLPRGSATPAALPGIDVTGISLAVTHFELLHNPGGRYDSLARWPLAGAPLAPLPQQTMLF